MLLLNPNKQLVYFTVLEVGKVAIYQDEQHIWLEVDDVIQSAIDIEFPYRPALPHCYLMMLPLLIDKEPCTVLELGGGGFAMQRYLAATHPDIDVTTVEIDQDIIDMVNRYFPKTRPYQYLNEDARDTLSRLKTNNTQYDWIVYDAFDGAVSPMQSELRTNLETMWQAISQDGWLIINSLESDAVVVRTMLLQIHSTTNRIPLVLKPQHYKNLIILTAKSNEVEVPEELAAENLFTNLTQI